MEQDRTQNEEVTELIALLRTAAGEIMNDAASAALARPHELSGIDGVLTDLRQAAADVGTLVGAAEVVARRINPTLSSSASVL